MRALRGTAQKFCLGIVLNLRTVPYLSLAILNLDQRDPVTTSTLNALDFSRTLLLDISHTLLDISRTRLLARLGLRPPRTPPHVGPVHPPPL